MDKLLVEVYGFSRINGPFRTVFYKDKEDKVKYKYVNTCCKNTCENHISKKAMTSDYCPQCGSAVREIQVQQPPKEKGEPIDVLQFSHMLRIHEQHYLMYSENYKSFSLCYKYEQSKGEAGGGFREWRTMSIPVVIQTEQDAINLRTYRSNYSGVFIRYFYYV